eukprot:m.51599 g.51599  ORF g.51599 m.51599 type:complete len:739 (+) comp12236_c0_seq1:164-2380(+)
MADKLWEAEVRRTMAQGMGFHEQHRPQDALRSYLRSAREVVTRLTLEVDSAQPAVPLPADIRARVLKQAQFCLELACQIAEQPPVVAAAPARQTLPAPLLSPLMSPSVSPSQKFPTSQGFQLDSASTRLPATARPAQASGGRPRASTVAYGHTRSASSPTPTTLPVAGQRCTTKQGTPSLLAQPPRSAARLTPMQQLELDAEQLERKFKHRMSKAPVAKQSELRLRLLRELGTITAIAKDRQRQFDRQLEEQQQTRRQARLQQLSVTDASLEGSGILEEVVEFECQRDQSAALRELRRTPNDQDLAAKLVMDVLSSPDHPLSKRLAVLKHTLMKSLSQDCSSIAGLTGMCGQVRQLSEELESMLFQCYPELVDSDVETEMIEKARCIAEQFVYDESIVQLLRLHAANVMSEQTATLAALMARPITLEACDAKPQFCLDEDPEPYVTAIWDLQRVATELTPTEMLRCVVRASQSLVGCVEEYYTSRGEDVPEVPSDDLLPLLRFALMKSGQNSLVADVTLMDHLMPDRLAKGAPGFTLASLQVAMQFTLMMGAQHAEGAGGYRWHGSSGDVEVGPASSPDDHPCLGGADHADAGVDASQEDGSERDTDLDSGVAGQQFEPSLFPAASIGEPKDLTGDQTATAAGFEPSLTENVGDAAHASVESLPSAVQTDTVTVPATGTSPAIVTTYAPATSPSRPIAPTVVGSTPSLPSKRASRNLSSSELDDLADELLGSDEDDLV